MKLYGAITSERASKGQGGEYLEIDVKGEDKRTLLELNIKEEGNNYLIEGYVIHPDYAPTRRREQYLRYEVSKGKCPDCFAEYKEPTMWCETCEDKKEQKGKKQKGEDDVCNDCGDIITPNHNCINQ